MNCRATRTASSIASPSPRAGRRRNDMKPNGPIPPGFVADANGMLLIAGDRADTLADAAGDTPLFVYDSAMLTARVAEWRAAMPTEVQLHYALKANPYAPLLDRKSVVSGKSVSVRVDLGGRRIVKKKRH